MPAMTGTAPKAVAMTRSFRGWIRRPFSAWDTVAGPRIAGPATADSWGTAESAEVARRISIRDLVGVENPASQSPPPHLLRVARRIGQAGTVPQPMLEWPHLGAAA